MNAEPSDASKQPVTAGPRTAKVAVLYTSASSVVGDIGRAMGLAQVGGALDKGAPASLLLRLTGRRWYPATASTPWQIEGVVRGLRDLGINELAAVYGTSRAENEPGEASSKQKAARERMRLPVTYLHDRDAAWVRYAPRAAMPALGRAFPDGVELPQSLFGSNLVQLPVMRTDSLTTIAGAVSGGLSLLRSSRQIGRSQLPQALVDLLAIQQEVCAGSFAVMDATIAGDGRGRAPRPQVKNLVLASGDLVALDAVAARLMGFEPLSIDYIRLAHERGLGVGDPQQIDVVGMDLSSVSFGFSAEASRAQKLASSGPLRLLGQTLLASWTRGAADAYYDRVWYPLAGRGQVKAMADTEWGRLLGSY